MGSTGIVLSILSRICVKEKESCLYFALAEDGRNIMSRLVANVSRNLAIFRSEYEHELKDTLRRIEEIRNILNDTIR